MSGARPDGSGAHSWWSSYIDSEDIGSADQVSLSDNDDYFFLYGRDGYAASADLNSFLVKRVNRIYNKNEAVDFVKLFPSGGYFISDSEGSEWYTSNTHFFKELKKGNDKILDVASAQDGAWIIIRPERFIPSTGISNHLQRELTTFYRVHRTRKEKRGKEIRKEKECRGELARKAEKKTTRSFETS